MMKLGFSPDNRTKKLFLWVVVLVVGLLSIGATQAVFAKKYKALPEKFHYYYDNNIAFYNPCSGGTGGSNSSSSSCFVPSEITWADIDECGQWMYYCVAKKMMSTYGRFAMALQEEYGYPWEVLFAQMLAESELGVSGDAGHRDQQIKELSNGTEFNLMGITVEDNDTIMHWADNKYDLTPGQHQWPGFKNVSNMLVAYIVEFPRRSNSTSQKLSVLQPDNYDLEAYVRSYLGGYSQDSTQADAVLGFINGSWSGNEYSSNGVIGYVRDELGLPSSAELASEENIQPGGRWPIDEYTGYQEVSNASFERYGVNGMECDEGSLSSNETLSRSSSGSSDLLLSGNNAIVEKARELAWEEGSQDAVQRAKDAFISASEEVGTAGNDDCLVFVETVVLSSGVDESFPTIYSDGGENEGAVAEYMDSSDKWEKIEVASASDLRAGDILITPSRTRGNRHTFVYLGDNKVAQAFSGEYYGKIVSLSDAWCKEFGGSTEFKCVDEPFVVYRLKTDCAKSDVVWEDGWIIDGIDGYVKNPSQTQEDSAWRTEYVTNSPGTGVVGPNKITLHTLEGVFSDASEPGTNAYGGELSGYPPHFTIDMKRKRIWQHFPIDKPSCAIKTYDSAAGVQIEIMGYSSSSAAASQGKMDWLLSDATNFSNEDWAYLGELLNAISAETGIPLTISVDTANPSRLSESEYQAYEGVIGHIHTPVPNDHGDPASGVWPFIEDAIADSATCFSNRDDSDSDGVDVCGDSENSNHSWTGDFPVWGQCDVDASGGHVWNYTFNACGNMCSCGCGVVAFAMIATALTGVTHDPVEVGMAVDRHGLMTNYGSSWELPTVLADEFGLVAESISRDESTVSSYLRDGWMMWTCGHAVPGLFSTGGHCIGVRGITDDGKWLLADSGNTANMSVPFEPGTILTGLANNDGVPMVALKKKGT